MPPTVENASDPPKRLTNLPSNIFLGHIAPKLKTRNIARLNMETGGKVPGLAQEARKINAQRKQAAIAIIKKQQHALARRIATVMIGIRMAFRKKHSANVKNKAWLNRYSRPGPASLGSRLQYNNKYIIEERNEDENEDSLPGVSYFLRFPWFWWTLDISILHPRNICKQRMDSKVLEHVDVEHRERVEPYSRDRGEAFL